VEKTNFDKKKQKFQIKVIFSSVYAKFAQKFSKLLQFYQKLPKSIPILSKSKTQRNCSRLLISNGTNQSSPINNVPGIPESTRKSPKGTKTKNIHQIFKESTNQTKNSQKPANFSLSAFFRSLSNFIQFLL
jgi:hypothetical protein